MSILNLEYTVVEETIDKIMISSEKIESIAVEMIQAGMGLDGFEGETGQAVQERFSYKYQALLREVMDCQENTFRKLEQIKELFLEVDMREDAVIFYSRLEENDRMTERYYNSLEDELLRYNQHLSDEGHIDVELEYMPIPLLCEGKYYRNWEEQEAESAGTLLRNYWGKHE